jgi:hypothetical protein
MNQIVVVVEPVATVEPVETVELDETVEIVAAHYLIH